MRQEIKIAALYGALVLSTTAAAAQTQSAPHATGPLREAVCFVGGGPVWGGMDPDPNIRASLLREFGGFVTVRAGKARSGATRCEPAR